MVSGEFVNTFLLARASLTRLTRDSHRSIVVQRQSVEQLPSPPFESSEAHLTVRVFSLRLDLFYKYLNRWGVKF